MATKTVKKPLTPAEEKKRISDGLAAGKIFYIGGKKFEATKGEPETATPSGSAEAGKTAAKTSTGTG